MNVLFHAHDRSLPVVQLHTAFVHFATFKIIFPRFPQIRGNLGKPEPQIPGNLGRTERLRLPQFVCIWHICFPGFKVSFFKNKRPIARQNSENGFVTWSRRSTPEGKACNSSPPYNRHVRKTQLGVKTYATFFPTRVSTICQIHMQHMRTVWLRSVIRNLSQYGLKSGFQSLRTIPSE